MYHELTRVSDSHSGWFHWGSASSSPHCAPRPGCVSEDPIEQQDQWEGCPLVSVTTPGFCRWDLNSPLVGNNYKIRWIIYTGRAATNVYFPLNVIITINSIIYKTFLKVLFKHPNHPNNDLKKIKVANPYLRSWNQQMFTFLLHFIVKIVEDYFYVWLKNDLYTTNRHMCAS